MTRTYTLRDLRRAAAKYGATVDDASGPRTFDFNMDLPSGLVWRATLGHTILVWSYRGLAADNPSTRSALFAEGIELMAMGTCDCDNPDCDECHPEPE